MEYNETDMDELDQSLKPGSYYLDSLSIYPSVKVDIQHENEKILILIREHPITQVPWLLNTVGLLTILGLLNFILPQVFAANQIIFLNLFGFFLILSYAWLSFLKWYFEVGLITNERILDIDFNSVLYKEVTVSKLENIQEITSQSGGYIRTLFNYGDVFILTAGADVNIEVHNAPDPGLVVKLLNRFMNENNGPN